MRDTIITRRTLLALAAGIATCVGPLGSVEARPPVKTRPRQSRIRPRVVALDPGHGGVDPGAISPHGVYEKNLTLLTARELAHRLGMTGRYRPLLTRDGDSFVSLRGRVVRARANHAELFLSIHADLLPDRAMRGLSVYTLSNAASDRVTAALASRENKDDFIAGVRLSHQPRQIGAILLDLARRHTDNLSLILAHTIVEELGRTVKLLETPHRAAGFAVLSATDIPSALVELGCLSNSADERLLQERSYQRRLAEGLTHAIDDFFATGGAA